MIPVLCAVETSLKIQKFLVYSLVLGHNGRALAGNILVLALFRSYSLVLQQSIKSRSELFHQGGLLVIRGEEATLMWSKLLKLCLEKLVLIIGY